MAAIGCLLPFLMLLVGGGIGGAMAGASGGLWGGGAGFLVGVCLMLIGLRLFEKARTGLSE